MKFLVFSILISSTFAAQGPFRITNRVFPVGFDEAQGNIVFDQLETLVNNSGKVPEIDVGTYLKSIGDATILSQKGQGVDYGTDIDLFSVSLSLGAGLDIGNDNSFSDIFGGDIDFESAQGIGVSPSLTLGLNLGFLKLPIIKDIDAFINFGTVDLGQFADELDGSVSSFGVHGKYKLFGGFTTMNAATLGLVKWTGIDIISGFEIVNMDLKYTTKSVPNQNFDSGGVSGTVENIVTTIGADISTFSMPVEVQTSVRLLYILSLYGGIGFDFNSGSSKGIGDAKGDAVATQGPLTGSGTAVVDLGDDKDPSGFMNRIFGGIQFSIGPAKIFAQLQKRLNDSNQYATQFGLRASF